jgi:hypothetical protein
MTNNMLDRKDHNARAWLHYFIISIVLVVAVGLFAWFAEDEMVAADQMPDRATHASNSSSMGGDDREAIKSLDSDQAK